MRKWIILVVTCIACKTNRREVPATIVERRALGHDSIQILYQFHTGQKMLTDSLKTGNHAIPGDSFPVFFVPANPAENRLQLP